MKKIFLGIIIVSFLFDFYFLNSARAVTKIWDGGGADNSASTAANWDNDTLPSPGDDIVFDATSTKNCTWDLTGGTYTPVNNVSLNSGYTGTVTLAQNTEFSGTLTVSSGTFDGAGYALNVAEVNISGGTFQNTRPQGNPQITLSSGTWNQGDYSVELGRFYQTGGTFNGPTSGTYQFYLHESDPGPDSFTFHRTGGTWNSNSLHTISFYGESINCTILSGGAVLPIVRVTTGVGLSNPPTLKPGDDLNIKALGVGNVDQSGIFDASGTSYNITCRDNLWIYTGSDFIKGSGTVTFTNSEDGSSTWLDGDGDNDIGRVVISAGTTSLNTGSDAGPGVKCTSLTVKSGATFSAQDRQLIISGSGTGTNKPFLVETGATFNRNTSSLIFSGTGTSDVEAVNYYKLYFDNGTFNLSGDIGIFNYLYIYSDATLNANSYTIDVFGDMYNYGSFNSGTSTVNLRDQTNTAHHIFGFSGSSGFYNLNVVCDNSGDDWYIDADTDVANDFTLSRGTFYLQSYTLKVGGNFSVNTGTTLDGGFVPGTGTLEMSPSSGTTTLYFGENMYETLNNLTKSGTGTVQFTSDVEINGSFNINSGVLDINDKILSGNITSSTTTTIASGATLQTGTTIFTFFNVSNSGLLKIEQAGTDLTLTTLTNNPGSTVQYTSISGATVKSETYYDLEIKGGGTFSSAGDITCNNNFTLTSGTFDLNNVLTVEGVLSVGGGTLDLQTSGNQIKIGNGGTFQMSSGSIVTADTTTAPLLTTSGTEGTDAFGVNFSGGTLNVSEWDIRSVNSQGVRIGSGVTVTAFNNITYTNFVSGTGSCDTLLDITNQTLTLSGHTFPSTWPGGECNLRLQTGGAVTMNSWSGGFGGEANDCDCNSCGSGGTIGWEGEAEDCGARVPRPSGAGGSPLIF